MPGDVARRANAASRRRRTEVALDPAVEVDPVVVYAPKDRSLLGRLRRAGERAVDYFRYAEPDEEAAARAVDSAYAAAYGRGVSARHAPPSALETWNALPTWQKVERRNWDGVGYGGGNNRLQSIPRDAAARYIQRLLDYQTARQAPVGSRTNPAEVGVSTIENGGYEEVIRRSRGVPTRQGGDIDGAVDQDPRAQIWYHRHPTPFKPGRFSPPGASGLDRVLVDQGISAGNFKRAYTYDSTGAATVMGTRAALKAAGIPLDRAYVWPPYTGQIEPDTRVLHGSILWGGKGPPPPAFSGGRYKQKNEILEVPLRP